MALIGSFFLEFLILLVTILIAVYIYFKYSYTYWAKKNIPFIKPRFFYGNLDGLLPRGLSMGIQSKVYYEEFKKRKVKYGGVYAIAQPMLVVNDLDILKDIFIKDFQHFVDRGLYHNEKSDPLSSNLLSQDGQKWRSLRIKFTPTFTSGKIKSMFPIVYSCAQNMLNYLDTQANKDELNIKHVAQGFTIDSIGNTAFGIDCNSFKNPDTEFRTMARNVFENIGFRLSANLCLSIYCPNLAKKLGVKITNEDVTRFFYKLVRENADYRESSNIRRPDFFQSLIDLKNLQNEDEKINMDEVTSQAFLFFIGGFETSSSTMKYCLFELSRRPEIQEKVRKNITDVLDKHNGELTYDTLQEMKYLTQVLDETLRLYPLLPTLTRRCTQDYTIKNTNDVIEKGTTVLVPCLGIHRDPDIWQNPLEFDPERFSEANKRNIHTCAYMPFGEGPRSCIGMRFGLMQTKLGLSLLLSNYKFSLSPKTKLPLEFEPQTFILFNKQDIILKAEKIK